MPVEGLEPPLTCVKQILSLSRLPFRHTGGVKVIMRGRFARDKEKVALRKAGKPSKIRPANVFALRLVSLLI